MKISVLLNLWLANVASCAAPSPECLQKVQGPLRLIDVRHGGGDLWPELSLLAARVARSGGCVDVQGRQYRSRKPRTS